MKNLQGMYESCRACTSDEWQQFLRGLGDMKDCGDNRKDLNDMFKWLYDNIYDNFVVFFYNVKHKHDYIDNHQL